MNEKDTPFINVNDLRKKVKEKVAANDAKILGRLSVEESKKTLHELQVRQIELEMQSDELRRVQAELEASRARYFDLYDLAPVGYLIVSEKGLIVEANLTAASFLGLQRGELAGQPLSRFIYPEDQDVYSRGQKQLVKQRVLPAFKMRMQRANSLFFWVSVLMIRSEDNKYKVALTDITEIIVADQLRFEAEMRYRRLFETMRDAFARVEMSGRIAEVNRAFLELTGYTHEEALQLTYVDLTPERWHAMEADIVEKQVLVRGYSDLYEKEYRRKDGTLVPVELLAILLKDASGNPSGMWAIIRNIAERRKVERKQRELVSIVQASDDAIIGKNLDGIITGWNKGAEHIYGYSESEMLGKSISILVPSGHESEVQRVLGEIRKGNPVDHYETIRQRKDCVKRNISLTISPILGPNNEVLGASTIARDITERKDAQKDVIAKNIALREVLEQLAIEKSHLQTKVRTNLEQLILPTLEKLKNSGISPHYCDLVQRNIEEIVSLFGVSMSNQKTALSPKEIEIANMIKGGYENKEIAKCLKCSVQTIEKHRKNVRKKLGIAHRNINLSTYLQNL